MLKRDVHILPMLALATAGCLWGTGFFFGKVALGEMPVATMVLFRFVFACAGLLPVIFFERPRFAGTEWGWVLAASVLGVPIQYPFTHVPASRFVAVIVRVDVIYIDPPYNTPWTSRLKTDRPILVCIS